MSRFKYLVVIGLLILGLSAQAGAPKILPVQGYLTGADGVALEGQVSVTFSLHPSPDSSALLFTETQAVQVEEGLFAAYLGSVEELDLSIFRDYTTLYLGISVNGDAEMQPRMAVGTSSFAGFAQYSGDAQTLEGHTAADFASVAVPLGAVIDWYRFDADTSLPDGFAVCDGSTIEDALSPFNGKTLPDLTGRFTMGVTADRIGETGGSAGATHSHAFTGTSDAVDIAGGDHGHSWWTSSGDIAEENSAHGGPGKDVNGGAHSHGTHAHAVSGTTGEAAPDNHPPYLGMLKLMRIR